MNDKLTSVFYPPDKREISDHVFLGFTDILTPDLNGSELSNISNSASPPPVKRVYVSLSFYEMNSNPSINYFLLLSLIS